MSIPAKLLALSALLLSFSLFAQRPEPPPDGERDHRRGGGVAIADHVLDKLATVDPDTADRLRELREQDLDAFRRELRAAMMKHGPTLFRGDRDGRGGGFEGGRRPHFEGGPTGGRGAFEQLRREDPARFEELLELRQNDPEAFQQQIAEVGREYAERHKKGRDEVRKIMEKAKRYQASEDEAEKATLRGELEELVAASFDKQLADKEAWINKLERDIEEQRKRLAERKGEREALIKERLETILSGAPVDTRRRPAKPGKAGK
jgi:hypothetical protein